MLPVSQCPASPHLSSPPVWPSRRQLSGQRLGNAGWSHPLLFMVWHDDVIFWSSRKAGGAPVASEGCNLQFFLLFWVPVCVVICSVGITELTQVVGSLVVSWHLKVPIESVLDTFTSQENLFLRHPANRFASQGRTLPIYPNLKPSNEWAPADFALLVIPFVVCTGWHLCNSGTQQFEWLEVTGPGHDLLRLQTCSLLSVLPAQGLPALLCRAKKWGGPLETASCSSLPHPVQQNCFPSTVFRISQGCRGGKNCLLARKPDLLWL